MNNLDSVLAGEVVADEELFMATVTRLTEFLEASGGYARVWYKVYQMVSISSNQISYDISSYDLDKIVTLGRVERVHYGYPLAMDLKWERKRRSLLHSQHYISVHSITDQLIFLPGRFDAHMRRNLKKETRSLEAHHGHNMADRMKRASRRF